MCFEVGASLVQSTITFGVQWLPELSASQLMPLYKAETLPRDWFPEAKVRASHLDSAHSDVSTQFSVRNSLQLQIKLSSLH